MTTPQLLLILVVCTPLAFVAFNRLRIDIAALLIAVLLGAMQFFGLPVLGPANSPDLASQAISGFGESVVIILISLFILTRGLEKSGVTSWIARKILQVSANSEGHLIALFTTITAFISLFMNNLAAGALVLPTSMEVARKTRIRPSKLLIPVAYGSLLGGAATYFASANIIVSGLLEIATPPQSGLRIFDFAPTGLLIAVAGIAFLGWFGKRLLPDRRPADEQLMAQLTSVELEDVYQIGERLWEAKVVSGSAIAGLTLREAGIGHNFGVEVAAIWRGRQAIFPPSPEEVLFPENILLLVGREERVSPLKEMGLKIGREKVNGHISPYGVTLFEVILAPRSHAAGQTLRALDFRRRYGFTAVALRKRDRSYRTNVGDMKLEMGDSLLLVGPRQRIKSLQYSPDFIILLPSAGERPLDRRNAVWTAGVIAAAIIASILGFPIYLATLIGALVILLLGILTMDEAFHAIEWQAIFLIAGMYAVSISMVQTGLASLLGRAMVNLTAPFGPIGLAAGAFLLTGALTQIMGGQVTALVTGPVAISAAIHMGVSPQAIAVATATGCSVFFFTPIAHPVNILMIAPANYSFQDFFRIGWRLTLMCLVMLLLGMVIFWKL
jgi:di/tricarboxylate transporter